MGKEGNFYGEKGYGRTPEDIEQGSDLTNSHEAANDGIFGEAVKKVRKKTTELLNGEESDPRHPDWQNFDPDEDAGIFTQHGTPQDWLNEHLQHQKEAANDDSYSPEYGTEEVQQKTAKNVSEAITSLEVSEVLSKLTDNIVLKGQLANLLRELELVDGFLVIGGKLSNQNNKYGIKLSKERGNIKIEIAKRYSKDAKHNFFEKTRGYNYPAAFYVINADQSGAILNIQKNGDEDDPVYSTPPDVSSVANFIKMNLPPEESYYAKAA